MDDLFQQLKTAPPVNKIKLSKDISPKSNHNQQSMPPPKTPAVKKANYQNQRASPVVSPAKSPAVDLANQKTKSVRVLVERKKFNDKEAKKPSPKKESSKIKSPTKLKNSPKNKTSKMILGSKVQKQEKKQPSGVDKLMVHIRKCYIRLPKRNLLLLQQKFLQKSLQKPTISNGKQKLRSKSTVENGTDLQAIVSSDSKASPKRKSNSTSNDSSTAPKRGRPANSQKQKPHNFFIKFKANAISHSAAHRSGPYTNVLSKKRTSGNMAASKSSIKPTKFSRSSLVKTFGKHYFQSHVRIEKSKHPLLVIFESNARARLEQAKAKRKSKNLTVSFHGQVEIFGETSSSSESNDGNDEDYTVDSVRGAQPVAVVATPARLKKVENGKVVDDIEFDPGQFILGSAGLEGSTPLSGVKISPKRRERKSYSPLKEDNQSSPRKEQLKKANEKMPVRRLAEDIDEEDDDDSVEYIVPIDIPQRRTSRLCSIAVETAASKTTSDTVESAPQAINLDTTTTEVADELICQLPDNEKDDEIIEDLTDGAESSPAAEQTNEQEDIDETTNENTEEPPEDLPQLQRIVNLTMQDTEEIPEDLPELQRIVQSPTPSISLDVDERQKDFDDNSALTHSELVINETLVSDLSLIVDTETTATTSASAVLPEIPNTFSNMFNEDEEDFMTSLHFTPDDTQSLVDKTTLLTMQDIINDDIRIAMPEDLLPEVPISP